MLYIDYFKLFHGYAHEVFGKIEGIFLFLKVKYQR